MAEGKTALKQQALATLQAGRREISAEAQWVRNGLNLKKAVKKFAQEHTCSALLGVAAIGVAVAVLMQRSSQGKIRAAPDEGEQILNHRRESVKRGMPQVRAADSAKPKVGMVSYLAGVALKTATPFFIQSVLKFAEQHLMPRPIDEAPGPNVGNRNRPLL